MPKCIKIQSHQVTDGRIVSIEINLVGKLSVDDLSVSELSAGEMSCRRNIRVVDEMSDGEMSVGEVSQYRVSSHMQSNKVRSTAPVACNLEVFFFSTSQFTGDKKCSFSLTCKKNCYNEKITLSINNFISSNIVGFESQSNLFPTKDQEVCFLLNNTLCP